ncbi:uncharacterized protein LOC114749637 [Neltuma alba]|uniref:uncharacterized protein LOC114749637 n=1 Tax=Neltuma alba TaxID=207710 RepID=UPI0010A51462|nr:uncharacterized protein LOC114749637 [Prosopis alba]
MDLEKSGLERKLQLQELEEIQLDAYESSHIYKEKTKQIHDRKILQKHFQVGDQVLLFKARFALKPGNFKTRWDGPYRVTKVHDFRTVELLDEASGSEFKVNGHLLKLYQDSTKPP